jgi:hypothetical protein
VTDKIGQVVNTFNAGFSHPAEKPVPEGENHVKNARFVAVPAWPATENDRAALGPGSFGEFP